MADETTATKGITVQIVTPAGEVYNESGIDIAVVNTQGGQVGIMAKHVPILAALTIDELIVKRGDDKESLAVNGGIAEFSNDTLTVVADSAETSDVIDVSRAESAKERAEARLAHAQDDHNDSELRRARIALMRAVNRIHVAALKSGR
ncbi:F0F1 ATP synthase subunit epsilon [Leuconostoc mesenteroides]|uniref:F0F1 ATP synthase subunit epsilon n=1 Tax=Leuconostoc mesenteroides TaxID=1245 RepID=UPI0020CC3371|nr:F0F1 ATP synthase subunit epsilon [Leuconostoc mesenteroides]MCP9302456.1 F0F1 ATP synthase subunit epsilon [Leuconostoc mesenteroides]MCP9326790.1 F0F1 ATP synthase subunit epsilon [Leuconostoc mesenteroides]